MLLSAMRSRVSCLLAAAAAVAHAASFEVVNDAFTLNGKPITLFSGSIHYHRVHPSLWRDRLRRLAGAGIATTSIPMDCVMRSLLR
jgi:beta-galactosidase